MTGSTTHRRPLVALLVTWCVLALVAGCSGVPDRGTVVDVTKVAVGGGNQAVGPAPGQPPDGVVRGFLEASGRGSVDTASGAFGAARLYLVPQKQRSWPPTHVSVVILADGLRVDPVADHPGRVTISGTVAGRLDDRGGFRQGGERYVKTVNLVQVAGDWRISDPPTELVIRQQEFEQTYKQLTVYFLDVTGTVLVPDQRYISAPVDKQAAKLMDLLLAGPGGVLSGGVVRSELTGVQLRTNLTTDSDSVTLVDLTGALPLTQPGRRAMAAQIVYTLSKVVSTVQITVNGKPLFADQPASTLSNFLSFDPDRTPGTGRVQSDPYYVDPAGRIIDLTTRAPMWGQFGDGTLRTDSAAMSLANGTVAAVSDLDEGRSQQLLIGNPDVRQQARTVLKAATLTPPSLSRAGDEVWVVQNGANKPEVYQISASVAAGEAASRVKIGSAALERKGSVSSLQISPDGVRLAFVAGGELYVGAISYSDPSDSPGVQGGLDKTAATISNVTRIGVDLTDVTAVVFSSSIELLVAAKRTISPIRTLTRVSIDGSDEKAVTDIGLPNDVQAVAVSGSSTDVLAAAGGRIFELQGTLGGGEWVTPSSVTSSVLDGSSPFFPG